MSAPACPCRFEGWEFGLFSVAWHEAHRDHHLTVYPNVDEGTRRNLADFIESAKERAA